MGGGEAAAGDAGAIAVLKGECQGAGTDVAGCAGDEDEGLGDRSHDFSGKGPFRGEDCQESQDSG